MESFAHGPGTDRTAGLPSGLPPGRVRPAEDGTAAANRDLLQHQFSDMCGELDRDVAEADADGSVRSLDLVGGGP